LNQINPEKCSLDGIDNEDLDERAKKVIENSLAIGVPDLISASDIIKCNNKINTLFVANIFNTNHGLRELTKEEYDSAAMIDDNVNGDKDERTFRIWVNTLNLEGVDVDDLYAAFNDGMLVNKIIESIDPTAVNWKAIDANPNNDFKKNINNAAAVKACQEKLKLKIIGITGQDFTKGDKKSILAMIWQLARAHYLKLIGNKTEDDLVKWANEIAEKQEVAPIKNLRDKALSNGQYLLKLMSGIEPRAVNWDIMATGEEAEDHENNAKYTISVARKLGAVIFCIWEDIVQVNSKQMLILFASLYEIQQEMAN
jgi:plastin-1